MSAYESQSWEEIIVTTAVGIDKDKNSQSAVKWAIEKLRLKDNRMILIHVKIDANDGPREGREPTSAELQQLFLPYRGFCARKGIRVKEVVLQGQDVANTLSEYINLNSITTIVVGASSRGALARAFKYADVPTTLAKIAPDFCKVYSVSKGKTLKLKASSREPETPGSATSSSSNSGKQSNALPTTETRFRPQESWKSASSDLSYSDGGKNTPHFNNSREYQQIARPFGRLPLPQNSVNSVNSNESPQTLSGASINSSFESIILASNYSTSNFSSVDSVMGHMTPPRQPTTNVVQPMYNLQVRTKESPTYSMSGSSDRSDIRSFPSDVSSDILDPSQVSYMSRSSTSSQAADLEDELRRLKQEMKQITMMYNLAFQEAESASDKAKGIMNWKLEEDSNLAEARQSQEAAMAIVEREKMKCKAAVELAQKAQRIADLESEKRRIAERKFQLEFQEKQKAIDALTHNEVQYRRYTTEEIQIATNYFSGQEKIGEGGYGPVFRGTLDHTPVAIKVLRPDMSQGEKQFQREVEVLSRMRHPNMVILLGACPDYGCLVYEYMENGSLEDMLNRKNGTPTLSPQTRFRIAVEIATALNFLHRTRPEPLVHRDLKPANILLDRNNVSKISDVGLSRLVPLSVADSITQYCMTAAAGTFCYIDPEYQQTGMLGTKSDIYSLGMVLLQIITAKPAMGLTHHVETAIENDEFTKILDPTVQDWPVEEALAFAKLALRCCELRKKDRPDLDSEILPELQRIRDKASRIKPESRF